MNGAGYQTFHNSFQHIFFKINNTFLWTTRLIGTLEYLGAESVPKFLGNFIFLIKVNNKYQGPKDMAPFHLLLLFKNPNGFEI